MAALGRGVHRDDAAWWAGQFLADLEPVVPEAEADAEEAAEDPTVAT
jgi:hypothetical protein